MKLNTGTKRVAIAALGLTATVTLMASAGGGGEIAERRSLDGSMNNLSEPAWGQAMQPLMRATGFDYADGISAPSGTSRPSPRLISQTCAAQQGNLLSGRVLSDLHTVWGQFLDHDIDHTPDSESDVMAIAIPAGDLWFDPNGDGDHIIPLHRSMFDPTTGTDTSNPRRQLNSITAWVDGSQVYGSDDKRAETLRRKDGTGKMISGTESALPYNTFGLPNANPGHLGMDADELFATGDVRANENCQLTSLHELFVREHNRLCDELAAANPGWDDDELYHHARRIVIGLLQVITYDEYLPALLGDDAIPAYSGYDSSVDPRIANVFQTAAFRFGHSQVNETMVRQTEAGAVHPSGNINSRDAFFAPHRYLDVPMESWIGGAAVQISQEVDLKLVSSLRNFMFGPPGSFGLDLFSMNVQRARGHGLPSYNDSRVAYGLAPVSSFAEINADPTVQANLTAAYGSVDMIDVWVGGLAEEHVAGASVGPLFHAILADQFERLRDGDRFWYQIDPGLSVSERDEISATTFADVVIRNSDWTTFPATPFIADEGVVPLLADLTNDGTVDVSDLIAMLASWGPFTGNPAQDARADFNGDAQVNFTDLLLMLAVWG